jgi:hypothetical protein
MIAPAQVHSAATDPLRAGEALIARFTGSPAEAFAAASVQDWVKLLTSRLTAVQACNVAEHLFGVLPLIDAFFESGDSRLTAAGSGAVLGALGLFTPTPEDGWGAVAIVGERAGRALRVWGNVRVASHAAEGSIVLVQAGDADQRLAWLDHDAAGVELHGSRAGGPPCSQTLPWLSIEGATIVEGRLSRPVTLVPGAELYERLERYAAVWSLFALEYTRTTIRSLRRAARATRRRGHTEPFSSSQLVTMDLGGLEIETELATLAAMSHLAKAVPHPHGLALALSAARALDGVAAKASELRDHLGLPLDGPLTDDGAAACVAAQVGGALTLENELACALGLGCAIPQSSR